MTPNPPLTDALIESARLAGQDPAVVRGPQGLHWIRSSLGGGAPENRRTVEAVWEKEEERT